ncbi:hypothetical protein DFH05DRAFT_1558363 [Lentinula detonsa]|uniref:Uncharacterized protein n=1 Tax=Lentinula detonsa TaxID=2804962 RepID=A0A9W8TWZ0_9AGAR|nr:hypothetical protein DFH05DRAFT_1558363 [Lentinula detonsa]
MKFFTFTFSNVFISACLVAVTTAFVRATKTEFPPSTLSSVTCLNTDWKHGARVELGRASESLNIEVWTRYGYVLSSEGDIELGKEQMRYVKAVSEKGEGRRNRHRLIRRHEEEIFRMMARCTINN